MSCSWGPALVGTVGYWQSPAPGLTALAMPMGTGGARSSPTRAALPLPSPLGSLSLPGTRQGLPWALPLCLPPSCLPTAPTAQGCEEAVFPFLLPLCSVRGPTHQLGPHHAAPTTPTVLLPALPAPPCLHPALPGTAASAEEAGEAPSPFSISARLRSRSPGGAPVSCPFSSGPHDRVGHRCCGHPLGTPHAQLSPGHGLCLGSLQEQNFLRRVRGRSPSSPEICWAAPAAEQQTGASRGCLPDGRHPGICHFAKLCFFPPRPKRSILDH